MVAIKSVASILASYDSNQKFPVFGFGAKAPELGGVSHCFPLNGNPDNPEVDGIEVCKIETLIHLLLTVKVIDVLTNAAQ